MRILSIPIPEHTEQKLEELQEHYLIAPEYIVQKVVVDRVDEIHDAVILDPKRKKEASA